VPKTKLGEAQWVVEGREREGEGGRGREGEGVRGGGGERERERRATLRRGAEACWREPSLYLCS